MVFAKCSAFVLATVMNKTADRRTDWAAVAAAYPGVPDLDDPRIGF